MLEVLLHDQKDPVMSIKTTTATVYVARCDAPGCCEEGPWGEEPANAVHEALTYFGWVEDGERLYCPEHAEQEEVSRG